jgi:glycosyltransferase involved in cell wall biosynthesis
MLTVVLLTYNSAKSIERTLRAARQVSDDIHAVDSYSTDNTVDLLKAGGCAVVQRQFLNYSDQRNWAIDNLPLRHSWQMHIDADEELEANLISQIQALDLNSTTADGFIIGRKVVFMGRVLRHGAIARTWHFRIFRNGHGRCEDRLYDQHFVSAGRVEVIRGYMLDHQEDTLAEWTNRHNRWSQLEAEEVSAPERTKLGVTPNLFGSPIERKRASKRAYYKGPIFLRPLLYFLYRYILRLGFLDGREGLIYHTLQGFWFRFLIDAKIFEKSRK